VTTSELDSDGAARTYVQVLFSSRRDQALTGSRCRNLRIWKLMTNPTVLAKNQSNLMIVDTAAKLRMFKNRSRLVRNRDDAMKRWNGCKSFQLQHVDGRRRLDRRPSAPLGLATGEMIGIDVSFVGRHRGKYLLSRGLERQGHIDRRGSSNRSTTLAKSMVEIAGEMN